MASATHAHGLHLPGELIDTIVYHLLPDRQAIRVCALLCRAWVPWSQRHLFSDVRLHKRNVFQFLFLLRSPYCVFPCYVRSLYISQQVSEFVARMASTFRRVMLVDVIQRQHVWLHHKHESIVEDSSFHDVWTLGGHVIHLVSLFPALQHLQLPLSSFDSKVVRCDGLPLVPPTLKSLALICHESALFLSYQWKNFMASGDIEGVEIFLKLPGSSIRHLHIRPSAFCFLAFGIWKFGIVLKTRTDRGTLPVGPHPQSKSRISSVWDFEGRNEPDCRRNVLQDSVP
jgi:hypothetical protein